MISTVKACDIVRNHEGAYNRLFIDKSIKLYLKYILCVHVQVYGHHRF